MYIVNAWWIGANQAFIMFRKPSIGEPPKCAVRNGVLGVQITDVHIGPLSHVWLWQNVTPEKASLECVDNLTHLIKRVIAYELREIWLGGEKSQLE